MSDHGRYDPDTHGSAEEWFLTHRPEKYGEVANKIDLCMSHSSRPCLGNGCDLDDPCPRHSRTLEVVERLVRMRARRRGIVKTRFAMRDGRVGEVIE